jgi:hypothetical protein
MLTAKFQKKTLKKMYVRKLKTAKNHRKPWQFKMDNLKKEGFGIRSASRQGQPNSWSNLVSRPSVLCYTVQQQVGNFVCTSIFLSAFTMDGAKLLFLLFGILIIFIVQLGDRKYLLWVIFDILSITKLNNEKLLACRIIKIKTLLHP